MSQIVGTVDLGDLLLIPGENNLGTQVSRKKKRTASRRELSECGATTGALRAGTRGGNDRGRAPPRQLRPGASVPLPWLSVNLTSIPTGCRLTSSDCWNSRHNAVRLAAAGARHDPDSDVHPRDPPALDHGGR